MARNGLTSDPPDSLSPMTPKPRDRYWSVPCAKWRYRDRDTAYEALDQALANPDRSTTTRETTAYPCETCRGWHLTSKTRGGFRRKGGRGGRV